MDALEDDLGDLQLQVVFLAQMAEELGNFALEDVIRRICDKLERRHPHIFGGVAETPGWDAIKAAERRAKKQESALDGVAAALPALDRALKLQKRAARTGFDWPNAAGPRAKVDEELEELDREAAPDRQREELGDLLFAVVNLARHLKIDPEEALRQANKKFERRFRAIETAPGFEQMSLDEKEELWRSAKAAQSD
jgi:ATP diphosphatase